MLCVGSIGSVDSTRFVIVGIVVHVNVVGIGSGVSVGIVGSGFVTIIRQASRVVSFRQLRLR